MRDPERLSGKEGTAFERKLLDAGRNERLPEALRQRMARALAILGGSAVGTAAPAASAKVGAAAATGAGAVTKAGALSWVAGGLVALGIGGGIWGARVARQGAAPPPAIEHRAPPRPPAETPALAAPGPTSARSAERADDRRRADHGRPHRAPVLAPTPASRDLRAEIGLIDAAREAVRARAPARALEILRSHDTRFPDATLAAEAMALRIEALVEQGETRQALALARRFLAAHPTSPLAARVERLVAGSEAP